MTSLPANSRTWAALAAATILLLAVLGAFDNLNRAFLDFSLRIHAPHLKPPEDAVLVLIDEPSIEFMQKKYNQRWPWSRDVFAALFVALHQSNARAIAADLLFLEASPNPELDDLLGSYAAAIPELILANQPPQFLAPVFWPVDFRLKYESLKLDERLGHVAFLSDADNVARHYRWPGSLAERVSPTKPTVGEVLLRWYGGLKELPQIQVLSAKPFLEWSYGPGGALTQIRRMKIDEYDPEAVRTALQRLPPVASKAFRGKTVFVGTNFAAAYDTKAVPVSALEPGVLAHFTAWANAKQDAFIREWDRPGGFPTSGVIGALLAVAIIFRGWNRPSVRGLTWTSLAGIAVVLGGCHLVLTHAGYLPPFALVFGIVLALIILNLHHWVEETRRKQEVQSLFGSYVSPTVVQRLIDDPNSLKLGGEKKELSVYFSDLAGFTDLSETMEPEALMRLVNRYLTEMSEFILVEHGYLDKYIGDAIMAVFGAPEELPNHALAACRAAIRSRDHLAQLNLRLSVEEGHTLHARIGINTGDMTVGNVGSGRKRNYTVVGDAVNLASRLEGANKSFGTTILLGSRTEELARGHIVTRPVELLRVKGKLQPVQTYELLALKDEASAQVLEFSSLFERAYQLYQQRQFTEAVVLFEKALDRFVGDRLSEIYIERCRQFQKQPPGPDWDGVFILKSK